VVGGLEYVGQNKMCCNLCRLVGGIAALFILRRVGILSVVLMFVYRLSCRLLGLQLTVTCVKRWGLRTSSLSAVEKADAGQNTSINHLNPNVLHMMLCAVFI